MPCTSSNTISNRLNRWPCNNSKCKTWKAWSLSNPWKWRWSKKHQSKKLNLKRPQLKKAINQQKTHLPMLLRPKKLNNNLSSLLQISQLSDF